MVASSIIMKQPGRLAAVLAVLTCVSIFVSSFLFFGSALGGLIFSVASTVKSFREPAHKSRKILKVVFSILGIILFLILSIVGIIAVALEDCGRKYGSC